MVEPIRRFSKSAWGFALAYVTAAAMTVAATGLAVSGGGPAGETLALSLWLLLGSLALCIGLAALIVHRISRVRGADGGGQSGARLHLRFVALFSAAAVVPAIAVALFMGAALSLGLEQWFDKRVTNLFEAGASVGQRAVSKEQVVVEDEVRNMAFDLNRAAAGLTEDAALYGQFLAAQAERRDFPAAYVISRSGQVLARAESEGAPALARPTARMFADADAEADAVATFYYEEEGVLRALAKLSAYPDAYVFVPRVVDRELFQRLRAFESAISRYRDAGERRGTLQWLFALAYLTTALLVLLGAVRLGLANASQISDPIGRLADAAGRVAGGDLGARVAVRGKRDEVDALGEAFNRMTAQLEQQRGDLIAARQDAEERSRFTEAVLAGVSAGVLGLDRDGRIVAANLAARSLLGDGAGNGPDLIGRRLVDAAPEFAELLSAPTPQGPTAPQRIDVRTPAATVHLSVRRSADAAGGLVLTFDDMTQLIAAQRQEAWKDVARRIAHEIKNPLTPIQLSAERLKRKFGAEPLSDPDTFVRCTDTILRQVADLGRMVDEFASFARMPTPKLALEDVARLARDAVFAARMGEPEISFEVEGLPGPMGLECDGGLIGHVLTNLLKNAAEGVHARLTAQGDGAAPGRIVVRLRDLDLGVQLEVIDNGVGFPTMDRARLIEPYVTTRAKGTGLGLAIVARIVEDHGGLIELDDAPTPGGGALVRIVLPRRTDTAASTPEAGQESA